MFACSREWLCVSICMVYHYNDAFMLAVYTAAQHYEVDSMKQGTKTVKGEKV